MIRRALHHDIRMQIRQGRLGMSRVDGCEVVGNLVVDNNEDLNTFFCLLLQKPVESPTAVLGRRATQIELRTQPPIVDVDFFLGQQDSPRQVPVIVTLEKMSEWATIDLEYYTHSIDEPLCSHVEPNRRKATKAILTGPDALLCHLFDTCNELVHLSFSLCNHLDSPFCITQIEGVGRSVLQVRWVVFRHICSGRVVWVADVTSTDAFGTL